MHAKCADLMKMVPSNTKIFPVKRSRTKKKSKSLRDFEFFFARTPFGIIVSGGMRRHFHTCRGVKNLHFVHFWALGPIGNDSSRNFRSNGPGPI